MKQSATIRLAGDLSTDRSVALLLASNLFTLVLAVVQQWDVFFLMWVYWGQSVVIGIFNVRRILALEEFSTEGFRINNRPVEPTPETQRRTAGFFALHYGVFHLVYLVFLFAEPGPASDLPVFSIVLCIGVFFINHWFSYDYHRERERSRVPNIGSVMFFPYIRILPMHLMIVAGVTLFGGSGLALVAFLLLKTAADVAMHVVGHAMAQSAAQRAARRLP
jgi:hypothetical protein